MKELGVRQGEGRVSCLHGWSNESTVSARQVESIHILHWLQEWVTEQIWKCSGYSDATSMNQSDELDPIDNCVLEVHE